MRNMLNSSNRFNKLVAKMAIGILAVGCMMPSTFAAQKPITINFYGEQLASKDELIERKGSIYVAVREFEDELGYVVTYDEKENMVKLEEENGEVSFWVANPEGEGDDGMSPVVLNNIIYIPVRTLFERFGHQIKFDNQTRTLIVDGKMTLENGYIYDTATNTLEKPGEWACKCEIKHPDIMEISEQDTPNGNKIVTLSNTYGEPHLHNEYERIFVTKDGQFPFYSHFYGEAGENLIIKDDKIWLINDSGTLYICDDKKGEIEDSWDLDKEAFSLDGTGFQIEDVGSDFVLYRNDRDYFLTLFDLTMQKKFTVYKELLTGEDKAFAEYGDTHSGDTLKVVKQEGDILHFKQAATVVNDKEMTYTLNYKKALNNPKITGRVVTSKWDNKMESNVLLDLEYNGDVLENSKIYNKDSMNQADALKQIKENILLNKKDLKEIQASNIGDTPVIVYREDDTSFKTILFDETRKTFIEIVSTIKNPQHKEVCIKELSIVSKDSLDVLKLKVADKASGVALDFYMTYNPASHSLTESIS